MTKININNINSLTIYLKKLFYSYDVATFVKRIFMIYLFFCCYFLKTGRFEIIQRT